MSDISKEDRNRYGSFRRAREAAGEPVPSIEVYLKLRSKGIIRRGGYHTQRDAWGLSEADRGHIKNVVTKINKKAMGLA